MRWKSNYFEIQDLIIQFANAFDSIVIGRYNKNRVQKDRIFVRYLYAPKQRVLYDIVNKAKTITLPVVAISINSMTRDNDRVFNKLPAVGQTGSGNALYYQDQFSHEKYNMPTPVNISVNFSIITRYQMDMDQILSNFIPYTNPYIIISWPVPKDLINLIGPQEIRSEVLWDGNINLQYPLELRAGDKARVTADTSFTIKGWIFPASETAIDNIYKVTTNWFPVSGTRGTGTKLTSDNYPSLSAELSGTPDSDVLTVSAFPDEIEVFRSQQVQ